MHHYLWWCPQWLHRWPAASPASSSALLSDPSEASWASWDPEQRHKGSTRSVKHDHHANQCPLLVNYCLSTFSLSHIPACPPTSLLCPIPEDWLVDIIWICSWIALLYFFAGSWYLGGFGVTWLYFLGLLFLGMFVCLCVLIVCFWVSLHPIFTSHWPLRIQSDLGILIVK